MNELAKTKFLLMEACSSGFIAQIERAELDIDDCWTNTYVIDFSDELALLQIIDDKIEFNGYQVVRVPDISDIQLPAPNHAFLEKALSLRGLTQSRPPGAIDLRNMRAAIESVNRHYPLMTIYCEMEDPDICEVGYVQCSFDESFKMKEIGPDAEWQEDFVGHPYSEVTRVEFGGGYENALAAVAGLQ